MRSSSPACLCLQYGLCTISGWKCAKCEMRENLWLNLTDGSVLCGKWFFDGSGGNGHALEHYKKTNFPLAVKLDTVTPDGAGKGLSMTGFHASQTFSQYACTHTENFKLKHNLDKKQILEVLQMFQFLCLLQMFILLMKKKQCLILTYQNICYTLE